VDKIFSFIGREVCNIAIDFGLYEFDRNYCMLGYLRVGEAVSIVTLAFVLIVGLSLRTLRGF
jgi:hypothetical protein